MELSAKKTRADGKRNYLQVARTLRDQLDGLITSGASDIGTLRKILFDASQELDPVLAIKTTPPYDGICICTRSCCKHEQVLNPALWSTLPMELLQRVFAKLPFPDICRLKSLSKEWKLGLQSSSSEFTQALKESSPRLLARVTWAGRCNFGIHVLDERNNRWHEPHICVADGQAKRSLTVSSVHRRVHMRGAADAGLVCYVDKSETGLNCIFVINPMTGVVNQLPVCILLPFSKLTMMRIIVDRDTHHYKVIVVNDGPPVEAEVYDSEIQQWTKPKPSLGRIFGIAHDWRRNYHSVWSVSELGPCAYDCRDGKYYDFGEGQIYLSDEEVISYTLMEDRLFVLYLDDTEDAAFISEYCIPDNATLWVEEDSRPIYFPGWQLGWLNLTCRIHACSGLLFVFILKEDDRWMFEGGSVKKEEYGWVYEFDTCEWRALPRVPWRSHTPFQSVLTNVMCELHWSIQP